MLPSFFVFSKRRLHVKFFSLILRFSRPNMAIHRPPMAPPHPTLGPPLAPADVPGAWVSAAHRPCRPPPMCRGAASRSALPRLGHGRCPKKAGEMEWNRQFLAISSIPNQNSKIFWWSLEATNLSAPSNHTGDHCWERILHFVSISGFRDGTCSSLDLFPESTGLQSTGRQIRAWSRKLHPVRWRGNNLRLPLLLYVLQSFSGPKKTGTYHGKKVDSWPGGAWLLTWSKALPK